MGPFPKSALSYWQNELANMTGIQQGNMTPTELPEFKGMQSMWNSNMDNVLHNAVRQLSQSGVQGGKANQLLDALGQSDQSGLLKMIQGIYQQANQRGTQAANTGMDWQKFLTGVWQQGHAQRQANRQAQNNMWMNLGSKIAAAAAGGMAGMGGGAVAGGMAGGEAGGLAGAGGLTSFADKLRFLV